jgi:class 3 adenylate cyclase
MAETLADPRPEIRVLGPDAVPERRLPIWAIVLVGVGIAVHAVGANVRAFPGVVVATTTIAALLSAFFLAAWVESRVYFRLRPRASAIRILASCGVPFLGLVAGGVLAAALGALPERIGLGNWAAGLSFASGFWFAGAAIGSLVILLIDVLVSRLVPFFRGRIVFAVLLLLAIGYAFSLLVAAGALEVLETLRSGKFSQAVRIEISGGQEGAREVLAAFTRRPFLLVSAAFGVSAVLGLPAVVSACGKLADAVMERIHPLSAAFALVAKGERGVRVEEGGSRDFVALSRSFNGMVAALGLAERMERAFGTYVSSHVLDRIRSQHGEAAIAPTLREASVLFADIRGFTAMSEKLAPEEVMAILNRWFGHVIQIVASYEGFLDKFIGDAVLVVFNGPIDQPDHAARATKCAVDLQRRVAELSAAGEFPEIPAGLRIGVGVATGPLVCGNVGSSGRLEYTVVGDTVNLAARFLSSADTGEVWVSEATARALPPDVPVVALSTITVKGKMFPVVPYRAWPPPR